MISNEKDELKNVAMLRNLRLLQTFFFVGCSSLTLQMHGTAGEILVTSEPYAAYISTAGIVMTPVSLPGLVGPTLLENVTINNFGDALLGGVDATAAYAARISFPGTASLLTNTGFTGTGTIEAVSINDAGTAIIGGRDNGSSPYAALVSATGVATPLVSGSLGTAGAIYGVAINETGSGLLGGVVNSTVPYLAQVSPTGVLTELTLPGIGGSGTIYGVALNRSGTGLVIGHDSSNTAYAAMSLLRGRLRNSPEQVLLVMEL